jgi:hypothetical protein
MKYIAVLKTAGESNRKDHKKYPQRYPVNTSAYFEAESLEDAKAKYPMKEVMTEPEYRAFKKGLEISNDKVIKKLKEKSGKINRKKWWKFWKKG